MHVLTVLRVLYILTYLLWNSMYVGIVRPQVLLTGPHRWENVEATVTPKVCVDNILNFLLLNFFPLAFLVTSKVVCAVVSCLLPSTINWLILHTVHC